MRTCEICVWTGKTRRWICSLSSDLLGSPVSFSGTAFERCPQGRVGASCLLDLKNPLDMFLELGTEG